MAGGWEGWQGKKEPMYSWTEGDGWREMTGTLREEDLWISCFLAAIIVRNVVYLCLHFSSVQCSVVQCSAVKGSAGQCSEVQCRVV